MSGPSLDRSAFSKFASRLEAWGYIDEVSPRRRLPLFEKGIGRVRNRGSRGDIRDGCGGDPVGGSTVMHTLQCHYVST